MGDATTSGEADMDACRRPSGADGVGGGGIAAAEEGAAGKVSFIVGCFRV